MRKTSVWIAAFVVIISSVALYNSNRPVRTETFTVHLVDGISGEPVRNVRLEVFDERDSVLDHVGYFFDRLGISLSLSEGLQRRFVGSSSVEIVHVRKGSFETFLEARSSNHLSGYFHYTKGVWHGTNEHLRAVYPFPIYPVTNNVLRIRLYPNGEIWNPDKPRLAVCG